jgi:hypothetical protein
MLIREFSLVRRSNCWKPLKLILPRIDGDIYLAKRKNLGMVIINKMYKNGTMGNQQPSFFKIEIFLIN